MDSSITVAIVSSSGAVIVGVAAIAANAFWINRALNAIEKRLTAIERRLGL